MIIRASTTALLAATLLLACDAGPSTRATAARTEPATAAKPAAAPPAAAPTTPSPAAAPAPTAATPTTAAPTGTKLGGGVTLAAATPIDQLLADPKPFVGKTVRIEGQILDVCPKRGCWMDLAGAGAGQKVRFKVTDGEMVFPPDAKGKYAVAEGVVALNELTLEQTKEYVAYQQREYGADRDPATVTEPMTLVRVDGTGAVLRDRP